MNEAKDDEIEDKNRCPRLCYENRCILKRGHEGTCSFGPFTFDHTNPTLDRLVGAARSAGVHIGPTFEPLPLPSPFGCSLCGKKTTISPCEVCAIEIMTRKAAAAEGRKNDIGKPRLDLLPFAALDEVGRVLDYGAKKYAENNWRKVRPIRRYLGAALRHLSAYARGEKTDPESGLSHLAHAACSVLFLIELDREEEP